MLGDGFLDWLRKQDDRTKTGLIAQLEERERALIRHDWPLWRREAQSPPRGAWNCWVICAGRGFGKTRTGAEWVRECAILDPDARIALVAASLGEARSVMVEGESGVLAICPPNYRPFYEPSLKRLTWPNGAMAFLYSAAEPESLRGPQHSHAWCDEIGKWPGVSGKAEAAWDNLAMGLRLGLHPKVVATTTPRATALVRRLVGEETRGLAHISRGTTYENA
ncbi:MAG: terminase large subunit domain-containing protein, partial [Sphingomonadales bacterium]